MSSRLLPSDRAELARERLQKKLAQRQASAAAQDGSNGGSSSSSSSSDSDASSEATIESDHKGRKIKPALGADAAVNASASPAAAASTTTTKGKPRTTSKDAAAAPSKKDLVKSVLAKGSEKKAAPKAQTGPKAAQAGPKASPVGGIAAAAPDAPRDVTTPASLKVTAAAATTAIESDDAAATSTDPEYGEIEDPAPDPSAFAAQIYDYFIVLDYECTCEDMQGFDNEIIEFPAILMDAVTGEIVSEFHSYVRPVRNPTLTRFCTKLTGIKQEQVDAAEPFPTVLAAFEKWYADALAMVTKSRLADGLKSPPRIIVATDGPCDLELWLYRITHLRDGVPIPPILMSYVDVKEVFAQKYGSYRKIVAMLQEFGLRFAGNQHSGLDDSRNLARVMMALMQRGIVFARPVRVTDPGHRIPPRILNQTVNSWERRVARGEVPRAGWGTSGPNATRSGTVGTGGPSPVAQVARALVDFFFARAAVPQSAARAQGKYLGGQRRHGYDRRQDDLATRGPLVPTAKGLSVLLAACAVTQALVLGGSPVISPLMVSAE